MAVVYNYYSAHAKLPVNDGVLLGAGAKNSLERYIAPDTPGLFGGWIIHREGFRAPHVVEIARLQAWSLKPAIRQN
jgi:hypothetical protein